MALSRYYVRELSRKDVAIINGWRADRELVDLLGSPFRYIDRSIDENWYDAYQRSRGDNVRLSICDKDSDLVVAVVYLLSIDWISRNCELAMMVGSVEDRGKGLGSFAIESALDHAFYDLGLHKVYLTVLETNDAAQRLYLKVGFKKEGLLREATFKNNKYVNMIQMGLLKPDFNR